jgi:hypothetical protein
MYRVHLFHYEPIMKMKKVQTLKMLIQYNEV